VRPNEFGSQKAEFRTQKYGRQTADSGEWSAIGTMGLAERTVSAGACGRCTVTYRAYGSMASTAARTRAVSAMRESASLPRRRTSRCWRDPTHLEDVGRRFLVKAVLRRKRDWAEVLHSLSARKGRVRLRLPQSRRSAYRRPATSREPASRSRQLLSYAR